jgi:PAS domain S-box-containing protein
MTEGATSLVTGDTFARVLVGDGRSVVEDAMRRAGVLEGESQASIAILEYGADFSVQVARVRDEHPSIHLLALVATGSNLRAALAGGADDVAFFDEASIEQRLAVVRARQGLRAAPVPASHHHSLITLGLRGTVEQGGLDAAARELVQVAAEMLRCDRVTLGTLNGEELRLLARHGDVLSDDERRAQSVKDLDAWLPAPGARQIVAPRADRDTALVPLVRAGQLRAEARVIENVVQRAPGEFIVLRCERAGVALEWDEGDHSVSSFVLQAAMKIFADAARVREEEDARERARRLDATLHSIGDAVIATDAQNRIVRMNPAAGRLLGKTFEDVRGVHCPEVLKLVDEASKQPLPDPTTEVLESGTTLVETAGPTFLECVGGSLRPVALTASPIRDAEGATIGSIVVFRDRSEELEIEMALASVAANEAANRHRAEFLAMMNHEMRTPLNGVLGMTTVLLATTLSDEQREYAETVRASGEQLLRLVDDILDFAKLEAQKLDLASIQFDPHVVIDAVCTQMAELAFNQGLEFSIVVAPSLPRCCVGDPARLRQVLVHLVDNAIKFTDTGEIVMRVEPAGHLDEVPHWNFTVIDSGVGISESDHPTIFKPFVQLDSSMTRRHGGTGLGLALVRQFVDLMRGDVTVESAPGQGSTFRVTIPLPLGTTRTSHEDRPSFRSDKPVLVVSAVAAVREHMSLQFGALGLDVHGVRTPGEAIAEIRSRGDVKFAMILVDCGEATLDEPALSAIVSEVGANDGTALVALLPAGRRSTRVGGDLGAFGATLVKPLHPARLREVAMRTLQPSRAAATLSGRPRIPAERGAAGHVLVVDDNSVNLKVCVRMLEKLGYKPATAIGGAEAVEAARTTRFDLVLMDCQMPLVDGYEATRRIREHEKGLGGHVPIVALTANTTNEDRERAFLSGMDDFISKPITLEVLDRLLERWVVVTV